MGRKPMRQNRVAPRALQCATESPLRSAARLAELLRVCPDRRKMDLNKDMRYGLFRELNPGPLAP